MKKNLELILLIINWVIVAIQAFTIFLYGNSIGLFIIMLLALIAQVFSVYDNRKKIAGKIIFGWRRELVFLYACFNECLIHLPQPYNPS